MLNHLRDRLRVLGAVWPILAALLIALALLQWTGAQKETPAKSAASPLEKRLEALLSQIDGAGEVRVMVTESETGGIVGAVVITGGKLSMLTYLNLQSAVQTLLDIDMSRIRVIGGPGEEAFYGK